MKKIGIMFLALTFCGLLSACGGNQTTASSEAETAPPVVKLDIETRDAAAETSGMTEKSAQAGTAKAKEAYFTVLEALLKENIYPDGTDIGDAVTGDMSDNQFAVCDVDQDGEEELIVLFTSTYMAGMKGSVFDYDKETGMLAEELSEFPALTFYDNGFAKVDASHNQGLAGEFWPYSLYQHHADSDHYELTAMVDAWDRQLSETDYENRQFPEEADKSKTGVVYYIMTDGSYDTSHPVDLADYNKWVDSCIGNVAEIPIEYSNLTEENIARLGMESLEE